MNVSSLPEVYVDGRILYLKALDKISEGFKLFCISSDRSDQCEEFVARESSSLRYLATLLDVEHSLEDMFFAESDKHLDKYRIVFNHHTGEATVLRLISNVSMYPIQISLGGDRLYLEKLLHGPEGATVVCINPFDPDKTVSFPVSEEVYQGIVKTLKSLVEEEVNE